MCKVLLFGKCSLFFLNQLTLRVSSTGSNGSTIWPSYFFKLHITKYTLHHGYSNMCTFFPYLFVLMPCFRGSHFYKIDWLTVCFRFYEIYYLSLGFLCTKENEGMFPSDEKYDL